MHMKVEWAEMTALMELFVEVYCMCASTEESCGKPDYKQMKESVTMVC